MTEVTLPKATSAEDWGAPEWQMNDAYGDSPEDNRYQRAKANLLSDMESLRAVMGHGATPQDEALYLRAFEHIDRILPRLLSLQAYLKCLNAKASTESSVAAENELALITSDFTELTTPVWHWAAEHADEVARYEVLARWSPLINRERQSWVNTLSQQDRQNWLEAGRPVMLSMMRLQKNLQKGIRWKVHNAKGEEVQITPSTMVSILKGHPDEVLRQNTAQSINQYYDGLGDAYATALNTVHSNRNVYLSRANTDELAVSLTQNAMSREALEAMLMAIDRALPWLRKTVTLRSCAIGRKNQVMPYWDLLAPAPAHQSLKEAGVKGIPYAEGIAMVKRALSKVNPEMGEFIQMMVDKGWIDAKALPSKIGGAFYTRFDELKMPRVFSTYMGSMTSVLQQAHELGHAFHYWVMRDLSVAYTQFPMTLTEMASTFNEALLRNQLFEEAGEDERFSMLWQEMRSAANFLFNTPTRYWFERLFIEAFNEKGIVSAKDCKNIMHQAWKHYYGETATVDEYLWIHKAHFYKANDYLYNYPYTVGYLLSLTLMNAWEADKAAFYRKYVAMLRETGVLTVDELVKKYFDADAKSTSFWLSALERVKRQVEAFEQITESRVKDCLIDDEKGVL